MKILILLLALGLCLADAVPGGYQQIDTTEALADSTIQGYIQTGLQAIEQNAISKGYFNNSDFTLSQLNSVYEQVVNGANYKFNATFTDSEGIVLETNFIVHQSASTNNVSVSSFVYHILYPAVTTTITTTVPANSSESSNTTTTTSTTSPAESGETEDVTTTVETGETVVTEEEEISPVEIFAESGETATSAESGETVVEEGETSPVEIVESGESTTAVETETSAESGETVLVEEGEISPVIIAENGETATSAESGETGESSVETGESTTAPSNTTSTNSTANATVVDADGFTEITSDEFAQSEDLQKYFTFGFQTVVQAGINAGKIPNVTFNAAQALSAGEKDINNGELYKFTAQASNGDNVDIELTFEVELKVPAYSYKIQVTTTVPVNSTGSSSSENSTTTTPVGGSTSDNSTTTTGSSGSDNSTTTTGSSTSDNSTSTTPVNTGSGSDNTTVSSNTTSPTNSTNTTSTEQWVNIDLSQVQSNAEIQSALSNGFNQVMQIVFAKNYLPADNYTITQVVAASYYNLTNGADYKFTVLANNDEQTTFLNLNFTAYFRYSNQSVKAVAYHYNYYTKAAPKPPQNSTTSDNNTSSGNSTAPVVNNTSPANNTSSSGQNGYVALNADQIQAQDVQNAINWGSSQVVQLGIQKGKIPSDTYNITQVASVLKKIQPSGANYNATVTLQSAANVTVNTNFNVYWNSTSNDMILKAYSYGVTGIKSSGL